MFDQNWDRHAYAGVEEVSNFTGVDALLAYRQQLRERSEPQGAFLAGRMSGPGRLLEIGSGSGRLLIEMVTRGMIHGATGIDLSGSRVQFAQKWSQDLGLQEDLRFVQASVFDYDDIPESYDVAACLTGTFGYFDAIRKDGVLTVLQLMQRLLRRSGAFVVELYNHPEVFVAQQQGLIDIKKWKELPQDDPFSGFWSKMTILHTDTGLFVRHEKQFVRRERGEINAKVEFMRLFRPREFLQLVDSSGFTVESVHGVWDGPDQFADWYHMDIPAEKSIVVLRKP